MLWRRSRVWMTHVGRHLGHDVAWRRCDGWRCRRHGRGWRGRIVYHVWGPSPLTRVLHGVADGGWRRRRAKVLLWRRRWRHHHVVGVRHHGRLARVVTRVVVWGLATRVGGFPGG